MQEVVSILRKIGFDEYNAIVSIINFFVVYAILAKYLFPKLQEKIDERKQKIDEINREKEDIEKYALSKQKEANKVVDSAKVKANQIISASIETGEKEKKEILQNAKNKAVEIEKKHEKELEQQKTEMIKNAKQEVVDLSVQISEKILKTNLSKKENEKLLNDLIASVEEHYEEK